MTETVDNKAAAESLRDWLRTLDDFRQKTGGPPAGWKYATMEGLVLDVGREYTPRPLPDDVQLGTVKECFQNATELAMSREGLTYVEGYATSGTTGIAVHHAWVVDEDGNVIDNTWRNIDTGESSVGTAYIGIPVSAADHFLAMERYRLWGVLDLWENNFPALRLGWDGFLESLRNEDADEIFDPEEES